jgi:imidazoleglycerol phosphate synthase cyclase subunit
MLTVRVIPCLDVSHGRVVKGVKFQGLRDTGAPDELAQAYEAQGADELVFLDVSATAEGRDTQLETVRKVRACVSIPVTIGGGVRTVEDARALLSAGADKVSMNTAAVVRPELIREIAENFGRQCTVVAIDARRDGKGSWEVVVKGGREGTGLDAIEWAATAEKLGAGEILLTSWDQDGTREGYDLELLRAAASAVRVPIIASGGANGPHHFVEGLNAGASAVLAASIFHDGDMTVKQVKEAMATEGIRVRL